ncbi:MAG: HEAT repeat domain-containing protein [Planctomycetota bacterium]|nr:HEAT repeat domain-containing protein [Planctomycetota bacterium]
MPIVSEVERKYADVADQFHILAVHEPVDVTLATIVEAARRVAAAFDRRVTVPSLLLLDKEEGMFHAYNPDGLGDMVLLDARGHVVAGGEAALEQLEAELRGVRARVTERVDRLEAATGPESTSAAVAGLYALGVDLAELAVAQFVERCANKQAHNVFEAVLRHGGDNGRGLVLGSAGLRSSDAKRQAAVLDVVEANPSPAFAGPLLDVLEAPKRKADLICRILRVAVDCDAEAERVATVVLERSRDKNTKVRRCGAELLGRIASSEAFERLQAILAKDRAASVRRHAVMGLAHLGTDEAKALVEAASTGDKAKSVREAATKALAAWQDG